jgi:3-(3-hydroxy-phenyl)propionate hydroxylase
MTAWDTDIAIIGLGPAGGVLGILCAQAGLRVTIIERDADIYRLPRAAHFDHEAMRIFQACGIAEDILPHTRPLPDYEFRNAKGETLLHFGRGPANPSGWDQGYMFFQPGLEGAIRARLSELPDITIRLRTELTAMDEIADGVHLLVTGPGGAQSLSARYVVGCDGASSTVRKLAGIALDDLHFDEPWLVIDADERDARGLPDLNLQICDPERPTTAVLMGPGRRRWEFMIKPGEDPALIASDASIAKLLEPWVREGQVEIIRRAVYRFHGLVAKQWRKGRIFLAGDSAHQMPPFLGQGMCSGLRDAFNLAWKLEHAVKYGSDTLLDTYQSEREPHVRTIIDIAIFMGRVVCTLDPAAAAARDAGMLADRKAGNNPAAFDFPPVTKGLVSQRTDPGITGFPVPQFPMDQDNTRMDDGLPHGVWLLTANPDAVSHLLTAGERDYLRVISPPCTAARDWLQGRDALVRPDRVVFGVGAARDLLAEWRTQTGSV